MVSLVADAAMKPVSENTPINMSIMPAMRVPNTQANVVVKNFFITLVLLVVLLSLLYLSSNGMVVHSRGNKGKEWF